MTDNFYEKHLQEKLIPELKSILASNPDNRLEMVNQFIESLARWSAHMELNNDKAREEVVLRFRDHEFHFDSVIDDWGLQTEKAFTHRLTGISDDILWVSVSFGKMLGIPIAFSETCTQGIPNEGTHNSELSTRFTFFETDEQANKYAEVLKSNYVKKTLNHHVARLNEAIDAFKGQVDDELISSSIKKIKM